MPESRPPLVLFLAEGPRAFLESLTLPPSVPLLRRAPPFFLGLLDAANAMESLVSQQLASFTGREIEVEHGLLMPV